MAASSSAAAAKMPTSASTTLRCVIDSAIARSSARGLATATPGSMPRDFGADGRDQAQRIERRADDHRNLAQVERARHVGERAARDVQPPIDDVGDHADDLPRLAPDGSGCPIASPFGKNSRIVHSLITATRGPSEPVVRVGQRRPASSRVPSASR